MANIQNLKPLNTRTKKEQREIAKQGGIASGKVRAERKTLKEELLLLLSQGNTQNQVSVALINTALSGDVRAWLAIEASIGEKPTDKLDANIDQNITVNFKIPRPKEE